MSTPTNLTELKAMHQANGERYAAAVAEIEAAYIELAVIDRVMQNGNVNPGGSYDHHTFRGDLDLLPIDMVHPDFGAYTTDFRGRVRSASEALIHQLTK